MKPNKPSRKLLADNIDPSSAKKEEKLKQYLNSENSCELIAREWHNNQIKGWTERHSVYVLRRLEALIYFLGLDLKLSIP